MYFLGIDILVRMIFRKVDVKKKSIQFIIPISRILLKAMDIFLKETNKTSVILIIPKRLFHVNFFL